MIRVNKEVFDYSGVPEKDLIFAERWFNAPKPFTGKGDTELTAAYYYYRVWNTKSSTQPKYKGGLIVEKATGKSVSSPRGGEEEEEEEEEESEEEIEEEEEEMTVAMAVVRVE
jgi:hypothetical protein